MFLSSLNAVGAVALATPGIERPLPRRDNSAANTQPGLCTEAPAGSAGGAASRVLGRRGARAGRDPSPRTPRIAAMLAKVLTCAVVGLDGEMVEVEVDIGQGLPAFHIVGMGDKAIQEAKERVRAAIKNSGCEF